MVFVCQCGVNFTQNFKIENFKSSSTVIMSNPDNAIILSLGPSQHAVSGHYRSASETPFDGVSLVGR